MKGKTSGHPGRTVLRMLALCLCAFLFIQPAMAAEWDMSFFEYANTQMAGLEYPDFYFTLSGREKQKYDDGKLHLKNAEISDAVFEPDPYSAGGLRLPGLTFLLPERSRSAAPSTGPFARPKSPRNWSASGNTPRSPAIHGPTG